LLETVVVSNSHFLITRCVIFFARKRIFSYIFVFESELSTKSTEFSTKHRFFQRQYDPEKQFQKISVFHGPDQIISNITVSV